MVEIASEYIKYYKNENGPTIGVTKNNIIEADGLYFRDISNDGKLHDYNDWRKSSKDRAKALAEVLNAEEKLGLLFISSWKMGIEQKDACDKDETGLLDEKPVAAGSSIFAAVDTVGTTETIKDWHVRHFILRSNPQANELADWVNEMNRVCEEDRHFIPTAVVSNSRNENGEVVFGMNDAFGVFTAWPGTMGIAAAYNGTKDQAILERFSEAIRKEWDATGLKKGYMYMVDCLTDPRWQRSYGTFGESPKLISEIADVIVPGIQGSKEGVTTDGVALTIKHFPGGGARENGFDPHYKEGQWNVYSKEDSLRKYHLPGFEVAVKNNVSSIMPYYAKPAQMKSEKQYDMNGNEITWTPVGFAFNEFFIQELLRGQMGFKGYINSDSGITQKMGWGVEELEVCERVAVAINHGVNIISGSYDLLAAKEAYARGKNGYYKTHPIPEGYKENEVTLSDDILTQAITPLLEEKFALGMFENPYRDPIKAKDIVGNKQHKDWAYDAQQKSVVLLKDNDILPIQPQTKVYVEGFNQTREMAKTHTENLKALFKNENIILCDDYKDADIACMFINPKSGNYFSATKGYLEINICEGKEVCDVNEDGTPANTTHIETTLADIKKYQEIATYMHDHGKKVITNVNITLAWILENVEPYTDTLLVGFDTSVQATMDVILGKFNPVGKLPVTLPRNDAVIAVNKEGKCISPNDVPGFDKDKYMPDHLKDENGKAYAYKDSNGHYYEFGYRLEK